MVRAAPRRLTLLLVPALLAVVAVFLTSGTCWACSCVGRTAKQIVRDSDAAFVGQVVSERGLSSATTIQVFEVEEVYKGELGPTVDVIMAIGPNGGSTCGVLFSHGQRVAVALRLTPQGEFTTDYCSLLTPAEMEQAAGPPTSPNPEVSPSAAPPAAEARSPLLPGWTVAPLGLLGAVGLISVALWAGNVRARRRGAEPVAAGDGASGPVAAGDGASGTGPPGDPSDPPGG